MKTAPRKVTRNEQVNLVDLFYYLIGNWYWFLLCVLLALGVAYYRYSRMPFVLASRNVLKSRRLLVSFSADTMEFIRSYMMVLE